MINLSQNLKLKPTEILWISGDVNYSRIHYKNSSCLLVSKTLKNMELLLNGTNKFIRVHRGYLVNIAYMNQIDFVKREVKIKNTVLPISRRRMEHVREIVQQIDQKEPKQRFS